MKKEEAEQTVKKLSDAAFLAGRHSSNHESLMYKHYEKKAVDLSCLIVRHLTPVEADAKGWCKECDAEIFTEDAKFCQSCGKKF